MAGRASSLSARLLPNGPLDALRQVLLFALGYYAYRVTRGLVDDPTSAAVAFDHARGIISVEQSLHVFVEPHVQDFAGPCRASTTSRAGCTSTPRAR